MRHHILLGIISVALFAAPAAFAGSGGGQNMAGCGWGSQVFKDNKNTKGAQSTAATSNGLFFNQAFGITSGTSGCTAVPGLARLEREQFLAVNRRNLSRELSTGSGEYAASFAALMGCREDGVASFLSFVKQRYDRLFPEKDAAPAEIIAALEFEITRDAKLSRACAI